MDYNIYIRDKTGGGESSPTTPWKPSGDKVTPWSEKATDVAQAVANPDALVADGVSLFKKSVPWIAAALVVVHSANKVFETAQAFRVAETGDYRLSTELTNFRQSINNLFHPFQTIINYQKAQQQIRIENGVREQRRALLGDSVINQYTGKGV